MQMSTLDHKLKEKWPRKRQRVETENLKITQALSSKTDNPTADLRHEGANKTSQGHKCAGTQGRGDVNFNLR